MERIKDIEMLEILFKAQDLNKNVRFHATNKRQEKETEKFEKAIQEQFKSLYVN